MKRQATGIGLSQDETVVLMQTLGIPALFWHMQSDQRQVTTAARFSGYQFRSVNQEAGAMLVHIQCQPRTARS